ncbi:hypothetical protein MBM_02477 [Drepanopeziza brunnea f. sp. 'multigermtubi' MB_m1]|uniref:Uncharacterized protein n=1 Tax=Marssonina brunnea f. sp. multigermtubi (strain MB_m1) TaxID=1072389 RepID=K1WNK2_MARBU|nr:uncharacterized protein MBM_02477 [Drepanopeziza brunnea f. sp. 'multigermtubi' MB_m1]EKD19240.1 hypothetical protein MBM_02477 [Drepanopeziza brunnea f. sp. 'multigermtubi' MB_m1]
MVDFVSSDSGQNRCAITHPLARGVQGLFVSGFELTIAVFILCSFGTTFCWWQIGADVAILENLTTINCMAEILVEGGDAVTGLYHRTPLDFISRERWHWSLYWTYWINILRKVHINFASRNLVYDSFKNIVWLDIKARGALLAFIPTSLLYSGIFFAG